MYRICLVTTEYPPHVGGAARSAHRLAAGLARAGFDVTVFKPLLAEDVGKRYPQVVDGVTVCGAPCTVAGAMAEIERAHRRQPFDLFHGFMLTAAVACLRVAADGQRPLIASIRGVDGVSFDGPSRQVLTSADWVTSVSRDSLERASSIAPMAGRSSFIPNGVDMSRFGTWRLSPANRGVAGTVATFRPKKNIPLMLRAYAGLPREIVRKLLLVGDFYYGTAPDRAARASAMELAASLGIASSVEITGFIDNSMLSEYLLQMNLFVLSSDHEGLPNAVLEAAAAGLPIVGTAVDGMLDIFVPEVDALLTPPGDAGALAHAIERVLRDDALALKLSEASRALARRLTPEAECAAYGSLYHRLIERREGSAGAKGRWVCPAVMEVRP